MAGVGQAGHLRLSASLLAGRTRLTSLDCRPPLQAMRAHYLDPALPGMAFVTVMSPSGGVLQGDRLELVVEAGDGAQLHLNTASATRVYRMPGAEARQLTRISAGPGSLVEFVPDPYLPYAGSRFLQEGCHEVAETGTLILGEVIGPGRQARGEQLAYERFSSRLEVRRPGGELVFRDVCELEPRSCLGRRGMLGGRAALGSLFVVSRGLSSDVLAAALDEADVQSGCSELPGGAGAWLRVLAHDSEAASTAVRAGWRAARAALTGALPPASRRY
jgi:urease accessory protein